MAGSWADHLSRLRRRCRPPGQGGRRRGHPPGRRRPGRHRRRLGPTRSSTPRLAGRRSRSHGRMLTTLRRGRPCSTSASTGRSRGGSPEVVMMIAGSSRSFSKTCWKPIAIPVMMAPAALRLRQVSTLEVAGPAFDPSPGSPPARGVSPVSSPASPARSTSGSSRWLRATGWPVSSASWSEAGWWPSVGSGSKRSDSGSSESRSGATASTVAPSEPQIRAVPRGSGPPGPPPVGF